MHKLIIVEGPDFTGKSTLATNIASRGHVYLHSSYESLRSFRKNFTANLGKPMVLDRSWVSEMIYGPVLRPENLGSWANDRILVERHDPFYVFCQRPFEACYEQQATQEKDHRYPKRVFKRIWNHYHVTAQEFQLGMFYKNRVAIFDSDKWINDIGGFIETLR